MSKSGFLTRGRVLCCISSSSYIYRFRQLLPVPPSLRFSFCELPPFVPAVCLFYNPTYSLPCFIVCHSDPGAGGLSLPLVPVYPSMWKTLNLPPPETSPLQDRSFRTDLEALLCAENLVVARSSLAFVALGHSRARRLFLPTACGPGAYHREDHSGVSGTTAGPDNFTLLCLQRPDAEVGEGGVRVCGGVPDNRTCRLQVCVSCCYRHPRV